MRQIPEIAQDEALKFKEQALAILSEDNERIINSGLLTNDNLYKPNGQKINDFSKEISQEIRSKLLKGSSLVLTAYDIDKANNEINDEYSIAVKDNADKFYVRLSVFDGDHIHGELTFSNTGEVYIQTFDKHNRILGVERTEITDQHNLFKLADHINGYEFSSRFIDSSDVSHDESIHYLNTLNIAQFKSTDEYIDTKTYYTRNIISSLDHDVIIRALDKLIEGEGYVSYIILNVEDDDPSGVIAEKDGNIFYSNYYNNEFAEFKRGDEFNILGVKETADKHILRSVEMYLDGMYDMTTHFAEIEEPEVEPERDVKKTRTIKPGR